MLDLGWSGEGLAGEGGVAEDGPSKDLPGGTVGYIDPSGLAGLRIDVVEFAGVDPLRHWRETEEAQTRRGNPGYERVRMAQFVVSGP
ncbi:hypothetical protein [Streptomyces sp. NPDC052107]|uniref:hypothetical protein n=1 Tax=Streptomyces sp. NPDC052107 TaxID=3155632 RepID=UPI00343D2B75